MSDAMASRARALHAYTCDWWRGGGSHSRPPHCERGALPAELPPQRTQILAHSKSLIKAPSPGTKVDFRFLNIRVRCSKVTRWQIPATSPTGTASPAKAAVHC